jgi:hypothetical protein
LDQTTKYFIRQENPSIMGLTNLLSSALLAGAALAMPAAENVKR